MFLSYNDKDGAYLSLEVEKPQGLQLDGGLGP